MTRNKHYIERAPEFVTSKYPPVEVTHIRYANYDRKLVVPRTTNQYQYIAIVDDGTGITMYDSDGLPSIMRIIRKLIPIEHGQTVRTMILEHGAYRTMNNGRMKRNEDTIYNVEIFIKKW